MIITCPNCSTRFLLEDDQMPDAGRKLRCTRCAHVWHEAPGSAATPAPEKPSPEIQAPNPVLATPGESTGQVAGTPELDRPDPAAPARSGRALVWVLAVLVVLGSAIGGMAYLMPNEFQALTGMGKPKSSSIVTTKESWGGPKAQSTPETTIEPEPVTEPEEARENVPPETGPLPESPDAPTIPTDQIINFSDDLIDMGPEVQPSTTSTPQVQQ